MQVQGADDSCIALLDLVGYTTTTPSRHAIKNESREILDKAIAQLPDDYQTALRLYDLECKSAAEVAAAMGRSQGAVHMLRARALERLREILSASSA
jgi:RNA polymerase sigma factor (sigma-70 family)